MEGLTCGRIVHYVVAHEPGEDGMIYSELPGMVLKAKEDGKADLKVFACCDDGDIYSNPITLTARRDPVIRQMDVGGRYFDLLEAARLGRLPEGSYQFTPGTTVTDLNKSILYTEGTIRLASERLDSPLWQGVYDGRVAELKAMHHLFRQNAWETFRKAEMNL